MGNILLYNNGNTKEAKSEHRNYKKAFTLLYNYKKLIRDDSSNYTYGQSSDYSSLTNDLRNALLYMSDSAALYNVISDYVQKGTPLSTIKSAVKSLSLKQQVLGLGDYNTFMQMLSPQERAVIKSAIAYEDYNYPFIDDIYEELSAEYQKEKSENSKRYVSSVGSLLSTMNYNTPKDYSYNTNYNRYKNYNNYSSFINKYLNNIAYNNRYSNTYSPLETYNQMMRNKNYGTSSDIWGNRYTRYTNTKGDTWQYNLKGDE